MLEVAQDMDVGAFIEFFRDLYDGPEEDIAALAEDETVEEIFKTFIKDETVEYAKENTRNISVVADVFLLSVVDAIWDGALMEAEEKTTRALQGVPRANWWPVLVCRYFARCMDELQ
jgi:hypothetical protein